MRNNNKRALAKLGQQGGYSLVELLASVVATGVIAATTVPIVEAYGKEADLNAIRYARAALSSALEINHAFSQKTPVSTLTVDGRAVEIHYGYPRADATSISAYTNLSGYELVQLDARRIAIHSPAALYCVIYQAAAFTGEHVQPAQLSDVRPTDTHNCGASLQ